MFATVFVLPGGWRHGRSTSLSSLPIGEAVWTVFTGPSKL